MSFKRVWPSIWIYNFDFDKSKIFSWYFFFLKLLSYFRSYMILYLFDNTGMCYLMMSLYLLLLKRTMYVVKPT